MRSSTTFCEHPRLFAFNRNAMSSYFYSWCGDGFVTSWREKKSMNLDNTSQIVLSMLFATMASNYEMYIFSLLLRDRPVLQKLESLFGLKQRFLDDVDRRIRLTRGDSNILMLQIFKRCDLRLSRLFVSSELNDQCNNRLNIIDSSSMINCERLFFKWLISSLSAE